MKSMIVVALALVAFAAAAPAEVKILRSDNVQQPDGTYTYEFESDDGIARQEQGTLKQTVDEENKPVNVIVVRGSYGYTDEEGKPVSITYFADETGYHAEGDSIPKVVSRR